MCVKGVCVRERGGREREADGQYLRSRGGIGFPGTRNYRVVSVF